MLKFTDVARVLYHMTEQLDDLCDSLPPHLSVHMRKVARWREGSDKDNYRAWTQLLCTWDSVDSVDLIDCTVEARDFTPAIIEGSGRQRAAVAIVLCQILHETITCSGYEKLLERSTDMIVRNSSGHELEIITCLIWGVMHNTGGCEATDEDFIDRKSVV